MFDEEFSVVELRKDLGVGCNANDGGRGYIAKPVSSFISVVVINIQSKSSLQKKGFT